MDSRAPSTALFPYTTLFRSVDPGIGIYTLGHEQTDSITVSFDYFTVDPDEFDRVDPEPPVLEDRKSTRLNSRHVAISYAVFCLKKKNLSASGVAVACPKPTE